MGVDARLKWEGETAMTSANASGQHFSQSGPNKPRLIFWELTKGCNLRCVHCRASATELSSPDDLSTRAAMDIIDQIAEVSSPILVLSGGEPLFRSDIFQLAPYGTDKGLRVALATNGTLVTKQVAQMIVDSGVRRVAISLDGADALTHDTFRGIPGAFDAAIAGFRNLKNLGMSVQINTTIARHNAPRDIDPAVREVTGIYLYNLDDLEVVADHNAGRTCGGCHRSTKDFARRGARLPSQTDGGARDSYHRRAALASRQNLPARAGILQKRER